MNHKRITAIVLAAALVLSMTGCGGKKKGTDGKTYEKCKTIEEAEEIAGFDIDPAENLDSWIEGYEYYQVSAVSVDTIQITYEKKKNSTKDGIIFRKQAGETDCSLDTTEYSEVNSIEMGVRTYTIKGEDSLAMVTTWTENGYSYSLEYADGLDPLTAMSMGNYLDDSGTSGDLLDDAAAEGELQAAETDTEETPAAAQTTETESK